MVPADLKIVLGGFSQVASKFHGRVKGTGMGLPLALELAEALGDCISVNSPTRTEPTFAVTLPRVYEAPEETDAIEQA